MKSTSKTKTAEHFVEDATDSCELSLSADQKWMRLMVDGKLVASFHVNYVKKVLSPSEQKMTKTGVKPAAPSLDM